VNEDNCIDVSGYLGYLSIQGELDKNKVSFLNRMSKSQHNVIKYLFDVCCKAECQCLNLFWS